MTTIERAPAMYAIRKGARLPGGNRAAAVVGAELALIDRELGSISAAAVVARAEMPGTPLNQWDNQYHFFEWNEAAAAHAYREEQARQLIRSVVIRVESGDQHLSTRGFYPIRDGHESHVYRPVSAVINDRQLNRQIQDRFQNELLRIHEGYSAYLAFTDFAREFGIVFDAVDEVIEQMAENGHPRAKRARRNKRRRQSVTNGESV